MRTFSKSLLAIALAAGLVLTGCGDNSPPAAPVAQAPVSQQAVQKPTQQASIPVDAPVLGVEELFTTNWMIVLDNSGSMITKECSGNDNRMVAGGKAVHAFALKQPADQNFGLVLFTNWPPYTKVAVPLGTGNQGAIKRVVESISPDTNTPLRPAIELAYNELMKRVAMQRGYGDFHIVVVTDGIANQGGDPAPLVKQIVTQSPIQVHTVGFCTGESHNLNLPGYTTYVSASNAAELNKALLAVAVVESETFIDFGPTKKK
jgi:predicted small lipoprotein YifL